MCPMTGEVNGNHSMKAVSAPFLSQKVTSIAGGCVESGEYCTSLQLSATGPTSLGIPWLRCYNHGHVRIHQLCTAEGVRKPFSSLHLTVHLLRSAQARGFRFYATASLWSCSDSQICSVGTLPAGFSIILVCSHHYFEHFLTFWDDSVSQSHFYLPSPSPGISHFCIASDFCSFSSFFRK